MHFLAQRLPTTHVQRRAIAGKVERHLFGGSMVLQKTDDQSDVLPPSRVTDLNAELSLKYRNTIILSWTAPGDDFDTGKGIHIK